MARVHWRLMLGLLKQSLDWRLPTDSADSIWAAWQLRISEGESREKKQLERLLKGWENQPEAAEWAADANALRREVTEVMYAALVVALWAQIEEYLNKVLAALCDALGQTYTSSHKIWQVCQRFQSLANIDIRTLPEFGTINTIRVANNCFKHADGRYAPDPRRPNDHLDNVLAAKWKLIHDEGRRRRVVYQNIPVEEAVRSCRSFVEALIESVKEVAEAHEAARGESGTSRPL